MTPKDNASQIETPNAQLKSFILTFYWLPSKEIQIRPFLEFLTLGDLNLKNIFLKN